MPQVEACVAKNERDVPLTQLRASRLASRNLQQVTRDVERNGALRESVGQLAAVVGVVDDVDLAIGQLHETRISDCSLGGNDKKRKSKTTARHHISTRRLFLFLPNIFNSSPPRTPGAPGLP